MKLIEKIYLAVFVALLSSSGIAFASHSHDHVNGDKVIHPSAKEFRVMPGQVGVQVRGIVCSFCAYGTEKNLSKLDFLDRTQFGKDGVLVDIHSGFTTLSISSGKQVDFKGIYASVKKGGYEPVTVYLRLIGSVKITENRYYLTHEPNGQVFELLGEKLKGLTQDARIDIQAHVDAEKIPSLEEGQPVPVVVDEVEATQ